MAAAAATATADPPGYFVGRPLHYQEQQPQTVPPPQPEPQPSAAAAAPAVDDQNAVNAQVPGYYKGRVQPRRGEETQHNTNSTNAAAADQQNREQSLFAKWIARCFSGGS